jgi:hypothetical protein
VDDVYLSLDRTLDTSDTLLASIPNTTYLAPGASYQSSATVTLPQGISGPYYIIVFTNASGATGVHGGNTIVASEVTASTPFPVTLSPAPDLQVTKIITPSQEFSGQPVKATFTITNTGAGPTDVGQWTDEVLLSQDGTLDSTATVVASLAHAGTLAAGQSYTNAATFDRCLSSLMKVAMFMSWVGKPRIPRVCRYRSISPLRPTWQHPLGRCRKAHSPGTAWR